MLCAITFANSTVEQFCSKERCSKEILTGSYKFRLTEFHVSATSRGRGGAILVKDGHLIYGRAQNDFVRIKLNVFENLRSSDLLLSSNKYEIGPPHYQRNFLPPARTYSDILLKSKRYPQKEFQPKIEGLVFHDGYYYCTWEEYSVKDDDIYFILARIKEGQKFWNTIYKSPPLRAPYLAMGTGGKIVVRGSYIYFSVGDFSLDRVNGLPSDVAAQNKELPWGKVMALKTDLSGVTFVYSLGHRNPQGLLVLDDGRILEAEHGPQGGDELNLVRADQNYGWPYRSFGTKYGTFEKYSDSIPIPKVSTNFVEPLFAFIPSPAITNLIQLHKFTDEWEGDVLLGSLKAESLFRIRILGDRVVFSEQIPIGFRVRELAQSGRTIYMLSDSGSLLKMELEVSQ